MPRVLPGVYRLRLAGETIRETTLSQDHVAPLPREVDDELVDAANREVQRFAPKVRELLCQPSFALAIDAFADELSGRELIHTAYFEHSRR